MRAPTCTITFLHLGGDPLLSFELGLSSDLDQVIQLGIILAGVIAILFAANLGEKYESWRVVAFLLATGAAIILSTLALLALTLAAVAPTDAARAAASAGVSTTRYTWGAVIELSAGVAAALALLPSVRRAVARVVPVFRPESAINAVGLSLYLLTLLFYISIQVSSDQLRQLIQGGQSPSVLFIIATNQLPFLIVAFVGVGLFSRRNLQQTLQRLGLYWPGWRWALGSVGIAVGSVIIGILFDQFMSKLTPDQSKSIQQVSDQLLKNVNSLVPALAIALAAGIGEEIFFRGAILPRLGNVAAALLFAVLHAQYAISLATLEVFVLGLIWGLLRKRAGTTAAIIAHAGYDMILLALSLYVR